MLTQVLGGPRSVDRQARQKAVDLRLRSLLDLADHPAVIFLLDNAEDAPLRTLDRRCPCARLVVLQSQLAEELALRQPLELHEPIPREKERFL